MIGPQVFRFEYCYLLKTDGSLSITPPTNVSGIAAIVADIAVIDSKSKVLLNNAQIATFSAPGELATCCLITPPGMTPGQLRTQWQNTLNGIMIQQPNSIHYAAPGAFRHSAVRTLFLPLSAYSMITP